MRELEYAVYRAIVVCRGPAIRPEDVLLDLGKKVEDTTGREIVPLGEYERRYIRRVLEQTGGMIKGPRGAARLLGMPASTLRDRMKKLGIERP